ncbi:HAMP domain-containing sensor histidine kinase [Rhodoferax sp.]|uniref:sensor histidine kinase n=1 Tax=Rhodoferax sp. TaxID=50421 RepID=UPI002ACE5EAF|nr:HAMP domain-containing sensor histidine kinase [Rhodoferax sp.]MDZ7920384.1 HAMP domain-containing sensor histidine kinase [Rhodoferax sp.]
MSDPHTRIAELEAELAAVRREMQDFTSAVSHDLRAPLRHIVSFAQLVEEDAGPQLSAEVQGFLATISGSAKHLGAMLDALRELSRVGSLPLAPVPVDLGGLVQELAEEMAQAHAPRRLALEVEVPDTTVTTDPALLRVVLRAALDNAWKFTSRMPDADARIAVRAQQMEQCWKLEVQDNGAGFVATQPAQALRMFGRLHPASAFPGLGVGLALAAKAAQRLGGTLELTPGQPLGGVLTLSLPLLP